MQRASSASAIDALMTLGAVAELEWQEKNTPRRVHITHVRPIEPAPLPPTFHMSSALAQTVRLSDDDSAASRKSQRKQKRTAKALESTTRSDRVRHKSSRAAEASDMLARINAARHNEVVLSSPAATHELLREWLRTKVCDQRVVEVETTKKIRRRKLTWSPPAARALASSVANQGGGAHLDPRPEPRGVLRAHSALFGAITALCPHRVKRRLLSL